MFLQSDGELDEFQEQLKQSELDATDQAQYTQLLELKKTIEDDCDHFWRPVTVDWRPFKPVVKGNVVVEAPDSSDTTD